MLVLLLLQLKQTNPEKNGLICYLRINAELDAAERIDRLESTTSNETSNAPKNADSRNAKSTVNTSVFKRFGQGAIAASVAAIVLIAGGTLNPSVPLGTEMQVAEQSEVAENSMPEFNDAYSPSEFSRVPQLNTEIAGAESTDEAARVRLRQAVFQEFVGEPQESIELPVNFNVIIEEE